MIQPSERKMQLNKSLLKNPRYNPNKLLDIVTEKLGLKNDAALARELEITAPVISKTRNFALPVGPCLALRIMEATGASMKDLYRWMGMQ